MKIAYLIMTNKNPKQMNRLLAALQHPDVDFFIHIDRKTEVTFDIPKWNNITVLSNNIPVYWGGFSQVEATIRLMQTANKKAKYDYYILLSGSDYPVRSNKHIFNYLKKYNGSEFINLSPMPENDKTFDRIDFIYLEGSQSRILSVLFQYLNRILRKQFFKRNYPHAYKKLTLYGGCTWWALTNECAEYILRFITDNPTYVAFYKYTLCSDEMFFHTIIGNSPFKKKIVNAFMYTDWTAPQPPLPARITQHHLPILAQEVISIDYGNKKAYPLFARKFFDDSDDVIALINSQLRNI